MTMTTIRDLNAPSILQNYDSFTTSYENYLSINEKAATDIKGYIKAVYDFTKKVESSHKIDSGDSLPELITDNFDEEQIWQELELQNETRFDHFVSDVSKLVAKKHLLVENDDADDNESAASDSEEEVSDGEKAELNSHSDTESPKDEPSTSRKVKKKIKKPQGRPSVVDDKFFKLSEMEHFLLRQEQDDENSESEDSSEESVDLFDDFPTDESSDDDDEKKQMHYSDFFDAPEDDKKSTKKSTKTAKEKISSNNVDSKESSDSESGEELDNTVDDEEADSESEEELQDSTKTREKKVRWNIDESGSSDGQSDEASELELPVKESLKSSYETRQERLQAKIKKLEDEALSEKPWQLLGEASAKSRPENALLEEVLEFDTATRPAPVFTEESTLRLEDIIKQRVKDRAWDDVERRQRPTELPSEFKKKLVLNQEKSKLSLAQVYENEFLQKTAAADPEASEKPEEVPKEHQEITTLLNSLFRKLDALSNFHFTPKQVAPEVKIVTNLPAISMEEVAPVATTEATLLAPEEVKAKPRGDEIASSERTDTDKKRERRKKKQRQRHVLKEREKREAIVAKARPGLGNKYSKDKAVQMLEKVAKDSNVNLMESNSKTTKSSTAFFSQLQDEVKTHVREKAQIAKKRKQTSNLSAKRLKL